MIWLLIPYMAWLSRMAGGAPPKLRWGLDQWLYAMPYLALSLTWGGLLAYVAAVIGKRFGHGRGISLKEPLRGDPEKIEYLILWLRDKLPVYWYKVLILTLTGIAVTLGPALVIGGWGAAILLLSGAMKGPAYMIGWAVYPYGHGWGIPQLRQATQIGEFLTGAFGGIGVYLVLIM